MSRDYTSINQIDDDSASEWLKVTDFENFFNVFEDTKHNRYIFNLNETLYLNTDKTKMNKYVCKHDMYWTTISYKLYNTTRLAWLLMKINEVSMQNAFKPVLTGNSVYYIPKEQAETLIEQIFFGD